MLHLTGFRTPISQLTLKDSSFLKLLLLDYHCFLKVKAEMDQFIEGMGTTDILKWIRQSPSNFKSMFVLSESGTKITAGMK